jgi:hypothetical protein
MDPKQPRFRWRRLPLPARESLVQGVLLLVLLTTVYPGVFFRGESVIPGDILLMVRPWSAYAPEGFQHAQNRLMVDILAAFSPYYWTAKASVQAGEWPLWNPYECLGMPLMANMQSAVFYPPRLLHMFLDPVLAQNLYVLLKLWLCGMTAYLCGRAIGLGTWPSRFLSAAWMLAQYNLIWACWPLPDVSAWLPVAFVGVEFTLQGRYRRGFFATALGGTLLLLAGHPETAFSMGVWLALYFAMRLLAERRWRKALWMPLVVQSGAWAIALCVSAAALLPFMEYLVNSYTYYARKESDPTIVLPLGSLVTTWVPRFFGNYGKGNYWGASGFNSHLYGMLYPGVAVWLGMTLLLTRGEWRGRHRMRLACLGCSALLCVLIAFNIPALSWVNRLPFFRSMQVSYHVVGALFAAPLLAACGIEHWLSRERRLRELACTLAVFVPGAVVVLFAYRFNHALLAMNKMLDYTLLQMGIAAGFALLVLFVLAGSVLVRRPWAVCGALIVLFAADAMATSQGMNPSVDSRYVFPKTELTTFLQGLDHPTRISENDGYVPPGLLTPYGIETAMGYDGIYPQRFLRFTKGIDPEQWYSSIRALSVEYFLYDPRFEMTLPMKKEPDRFEKVGEFEGLQVFRDRRAAPRAYLVGEARVSDTLEDFLKISGQANFDPRKVAYVEEPLSEPLQAKGGEGALGEARVVEHSFTRATIDVDAGRPGVLVLADAYYPGWRAWVDGRETAVFPVDWVLRGVVVEPGRHRVTYAYFPASFRVGLALSIGACLGSLLWIGYGRMRRRRRPA